MRRVLCALGPLALALSCAQPSEPPPGGPGAPAGYPLDDVLTVAHLQVKGTHNSYHVPQAGDESLAWGYRMAPLDVQLAGQGVRAVELDVNRDPVTGAFQVFHVALIDPETTCLELRSCLQAIDRFSSANPGHHLLIVQMEAKDGFTRDDPEGYFAELEAEILAVFPRERVVTPADVQGDEATLREAIGTRGWPTLGATRGRLLFFFDEAQEVRTAYTHEGRDLDGRLFFVDSAPEHPYAGIAVLNDPVADAAAISSALAAGMIVRTRADTNGVEPAAGDTSRLRAALASGAQIVTTDYPVPDARYDYDVELPGGTPSRCNPVTAPPACTPPALEDPALL